jgi:putative molybdopterin biosynthesis protein
LNEYLTTRELAELLRIKERKVYDLASSGAVPCSRATGKLLFPRDAIESWIAENASGTQDRLAVSRANVILGSHDPLLEWAIRQSRCGLASYFDSSLDGLNRFSRNKGIASGLHIFNAGTGDWNRPTIESQFKHQAVVLVEWAKRQRGIIFSPGKEVSQLKHLSGLKMIPRQAEAGSQVLLEALLDKEDISTDEIDWLAPSRSEVDAVLAVQEGKADTTFGLASIAAQYNLSFVPIIEERFDLLVDRRAWFEPAWQTLLAFCQSNAFKRRAEELAGYRIDELFAVRFNGG